MRWRGSLANRPQVSAIYVAPGNGGRRRSPRRRMWRRQPRTSTGWRSWRRGQRIDLTVVGPEAPLVAEAGRHAARRGVGRFGPTQAAAQIEGSKVFAKRFMQETGIPTGRAEIFRDAAAAAAYVESLDDLPVIKASGLAAGKGVILPESKAEALRCGQFWSNGSLAKCRRRRVDRGAFVRPEVSVLAFCDGESAHHAGGAGPQTRDGRRPRAEYGGMGAFAPSPLATPR